MILSVNVNQSDVIRFKAPKGLMYEIHSIFAMIITPGDNSVYILNELLEDEFGLVSNASVRSGIIFGMEGDTSKTGWFGLPIPEVTKFMSIATRTATNMACDIFINYDLVKASKTELLWEWFRKGR